MRSAQTSPHLAPTTEVARPEEAIILYTGEHAYAHDGWITVLPLDRLCGNPQRNARHRRYGRTEVWDPWWGIHV